MPIGNIFDDEAPSKSRRNQPELNEKDVNNLLSLIEKQISELYDKLFETEEAIENRSENKTRREIYDVMGAELYVKKLSESLDIYFESKKTPDQEIKFNELYPSYESSLNWISNMRH